MHGLLWMWMVGCKAPPEAPEELDELVGYLYTHVPDEDPAALEVGAANLDAWLGERLDETLEGYTVDNLSEDTVSALGEGQRELDHLAGAAVGHVSELSVDDLAVAMMRDDPIDIYGNTYVSYERAWEGDLDCFLSAECDRIEAEAWAAQDFTLIQLETNSRLQFRWVETPAGRALIERTWLRDPATVSVDWLSVDQQYYVWMMLPVDGGSRSIQSTWVVAEISGGEVDEDVALSLVIDNMQKLATKLDAWVAGG